MYFGLFDSPMWWSLVTRITHSRHRKLFFAFAILQCVIQVTLRATVLGEDAFAISITHTVLKTLDPSDPLRDAFPVIQDGALMGCNRPDLPDRICWTIVEPKSHGHKASKASKAKSLQVVDQVAAQSTTCKQAMILPHFVFQDGEREDTTLMLFQVWLFILGVTGLLQDSIPHMAANLGGQIMNTAWAGFRISSLLKARDLYISTVVDGACGGADALAATWSRRIVESSVVLTSNAILLVFTAYLTIRLIMSFMEATYDRVGASPQIARAHKWALAYSMSLHGGFFMIASLALWISKIGPANVRKVMFCSEVYLVVACIAIVLVPVWMLIGWRSVCIECGRRFAAFSVFSCILLGTFSFMFASPVFKSIISLFPFFAATTVAAFILLFAATILGLICRFHFGRGLAHFLEVQAILARENFASASFSYSGSVHGSDRPGSWDPEKKVQIQDDDAGSLYSELGIAKKPIFLLRGDKERARQSFVPINVPITDREQGLPAERFVHPGLTAPPRAAFNPAARRTNGLPSGPAAHLRPTLGNANPADRMSTISTASNGTFGKGSIHSKKLPKITVQGATPVGQGSFLKM